MAHASSLLVSALRETARRLRDGAPYAWGHHGQCNCGHLAQVVTPFSAAELQRYAAQSRRGEWTELARDYCPVSGAPVDLVLENLLALGLTPTDVHHLEYLSDRAVLRALPGGFRWLRRNRRDDVVLYLDTLAQGLEDRLLDAAVAMEIRTVAAQTMALLAV